MAIAERDSRMSQTEPLNPSEDESTLIHDSDSLRLYTAVRHHHYTNAQLGQLLIEMGFINYEQLAEALRLQNQGRGTEKLGHILEDLGYVTKSDLSKALAKRFGFPFVTLKKFDIDTHLISIIPVNVARKHHALPIMQQGDKIIVAVNDPTDMELVHLLQFITGRPIDLAIAPVEEIDDAIARHYGIEEERNALKDLNIIENAELMADSEKDFLSAANQRPIVQMVNNILMDAVKRKASDIHIRPGEYIVDLLYRVDGMLVKIRSFNKNLLAAVTSRIKIIGGMDIAERRLPQDGRAKLEHEKREIDLRISVIPTIFGESTVIRLLDTQAALKSLADLGYSGEDEIRLQHLLASNSGIFLVTGPTGSGKSTTLYTALGHVKESKRNIITAEDPVEYHLDGITQIQINHGIQYDFAMALKHILRHDPDVIMIGEIRDEETAKMAIESALTGHLVLSTLHTNSASLTIARLLEIGIPSYLVNSAVIGVLAQRLSRRNCPHCLVPEVTSPAIRQLLEVPEDEVFYVGEGCEHCHFTGVKGRIAVYELLTMTDGMKLRIQEGDSSIDMEKQAMKDGMVPLTQHALSQARNKVISLSEVYRLRLN